MKKIYILLLLSFLTFVSKAQRESIAILNLDVTLKDYDSYQMGSLVRLYVEKLDTFDIMDKYDMTQILKANGVDVATCFGALCLLESSKCLKVSKLLTGSVDIYDEMLVVTLRL